MKNKNLGKVLSWLTLFFVSAFFIYREFNRSSTYLSNPFQEYKKDVEKPSGYTSETLFVLNKKPFNFYALPKSVQFELFKEAQHFHDRQNVILKDFATRYYASLQADPEISIEKIPPLVTFLSNQISPSELELLFEKEKGNYPQNASMDQIKNQIKFEMLTKSALNFYVTFLKKIYETEGFHLTSRLPVIPSSWLDTSNFPKLGSPDAINHLIVLGNYACESCKKINDDLATLYTKYGPDKLEITFIPFGNSSVADDYLSRASMCVLEQDLDLFWKFHVSLSDEVKRVANIHLENDTKILYKIILKLIKNIDIKKAKLDSCLSTENIKLRKIFAKIKNDYHFLATNDLPIYILNNSKIDLEGKSLTFAFEEYAQK